MGGSMTHVHGWTASVVSRSYPGDVAAPCCLNVWSDPHGCHAWRVDIGISLLDEIGHLVYVQLVDQDGAPRAMGFGAVVESSVHGTRIAGDGPLYATGCVS